MFIIYLIKEEYTDYICKNVALYVFHLINAFETILLIIIIIIIIII